MRKMLVSATVWLVFIPFCWAMEAQAQNLVGTYDLYQLVEFSLPGQLPRPTNSMIITEHIGDALRVRSPTQITNPKSDWRGDGKIEGKIGYYLWKFSDGKIGRTDFVVTADNKLIGHVQSTDPKAGTGLNWWYLAIRR